jgi:endonuclease/exonuclease/phosphatase family metal-dependent hydrolase
MLLLISNMLFVALVCNVCRASNHSFANLNPLIGKSKARFSLLTWNVWFGQYEFTRRSDHILSFIDKQDVDVVCLQEATHDLLSILKKHPSLLSKYDISDSDLSGSTIPGYGVLMMTKKALRVKYRLTEFPTQMDRTLLSAELTVKTVSSPNQDSTFCVGTVHLESLNYPKLRQRQLQIASRTLRRFDDVAICGDFNFCSYRNFRPGTTLENTAMTSTLHEYVDVWPSLVPLPPEAKEVTSYDNCSVEAGMALGFTFDSARNPMIRKLERMRYDRIMFKSTGGRWVPVGIELVVTQPIDGQSDLLPSDHFGLLAHFEEV